MNKVLKYLKNKLLIKQNEKKYFAGTEYFKYMLFENSDSHTLIIVFSSCTKLGVPARYHYIQTLQNIKANKLFILDDKASDHRGGYYIGEDMKFNDEIIVRSLIQECIVKTHAKQLVFVGSSKGAYAALNFGLEFDSSIMIIGAPQYYLGDYLNNIEGDKATLKYIIGHEIKSDKISFLNSRLQKKVLNNTHQNQRIYLHYSDKEETYCKHISPLISDLKTTHILSFFDVKEYRSHSELGKYFPDYLLRVLKELEK